MAQVGRKVYYDLSTGNKLVDTGECEGSVVETTQEQDFAFSTILSQRVPSTVGCLQFAFGEQATNFAQYLFHVDITQTPHVIAWDAAVVPTDATLQTSAPPLADSVSRPKTTKNITASKN